MLTGRKAIVLYWVALPLTATKRIMYVGRDTCDDSLKGVLNMFCGMLLTMVEELYIIISTIVSNEQCHEWFRYLSKTSEKG